MKNKRSKDDGFGQGYADMKNSFRLMIASFVLMLIIIATPSVKDFIHKASVEDYDDAVSVRRDAGEDYKRHYTTVVSWDDGCDGWNRIVYENDTRQMYFVCDSEESSMIPLYRSGIPVLYEKSTDMDSDEMREIVKKAMKYTGKELKTDRH